MSGYQPSRRSLRPAVVDYYFDADVLGLAHVVAAIRPDSTYPGDPGLTIARRVRPPCPITTPKTPDLKWIPEVAGRGWTIITRDRRITRRPGELQAIREHQGKLFVIASDEPLAKWGQLEVLLRRWRDIERIAQMAGPFAYAITRSATTRIPL